MRGGRPCVAWAGACAVLFGLFATPVAAQGDRAALLRFTGKDANAIRQRVQKRLRAKNIDVAPLKEVGEASRANKGRVNIARALNAKVLIGARVQKPEERWVIDVSVYNAKGKRTRKFRVSSSNLTRAANRAADKLVQLDLVPEVQAKKPPPPPKPVAKAEPAPRKTSAIPRLVIRPFEGRNASKIRIGAVRAFSGKPVKLVPSQSFVDKAEQLGVNLRKSSGQIKTARALNVDALVDGDVELEGNTWTAYVRLVDGDSGQVLRQEYYEERTAAALSRRIQQDLWNGFRKPIADLRTDRQAAVATAKKKDTSKEGARERRRDERRMARYRGLGLPTAIDIQFDFRLVHRNFEYNDDLREDLRDYELGAGPGFAVRMRWYPAAHFVANAWSQFGVDGFYERLANLTSERAEDGQSFPTRASAWGIGLRWRYALKRVQPSLLVGYGRQNFEVLVSGPPRPGFDNTPQVPQVNYKFIRYQGEIRWDVVAGLKLMIRGAFLQVLETGGISSPLWFPNASANGMEAELLFGYALPLGFEVRTGFDYRRYFFDLDPEPPNPPFVAGGALDVYWGFTLGIAWRY